MTPSSAKAPRAARSSASAPKPAGEAAQRWSYTVELDPRMERMDVELCWKGPAPAAWENAKSGSAKALLDARDATTNRALARQGATFETGALGPDACASYLLDLVALDETGGFMSGTRTQETRILSASRWMWRPASIDADAEITVAFDLPEGMRASVSWPQDEDGRYHPDASVFQMRAYTVLGRPRSQRFEVAGSRFEVVMPELSTRADDADIQAWLRSAGEAVATLYGRFPVPRLQVVVVPVRSYGGDPVAFGMTARGGGPGLILLLDAEAKPEALIGEWVAVHEMLHLGMPYVQRRDAWFSEGFATYYQQVVRARMGLFDRTPPSPDPKTNTRRALENLASGFDRAARGARGPTLAQASADMYRNGGFRRVYWGGAAFWLGLDVALRRASEGSYGADHFARKIHDCCAHKGGFWTAEQLVNMGSRWADRGFRGGGAILSEQVERHLNARSVPRAQAALDGLGIALQGDEIALSAPESPQSAMRASIFSAQ